MSLAISLGGLFTISAAWLILKAKWYSYRHKIVVFSRFPEPGRTKTRLIKELGEFGAANIQLHMTNSILNILQEYVLSSGSPSVAIECAYSGGSQKEVRYWLDSRRIVTPYFSWHPQMNAKFGERIVDVFVRSFQQKITNVLLIGADIPGITEDILDAAFKELQSGSCDMVLGPAFDGGYYLVGLNRSTRDNLSIIFSEIDWGTEKVLKQQIQVAEEAGLRVNVLPQLLTDVDESKDLHEFHKTVGISLEELKNPTLSIIVPTYNEEANIISTLQTIHKNCRYFQFAEILVCDGGSKDNTTNLVEEFAKKCTNIPVKLLKTPKGRAKQMNCGVKSAKGFHLLFLHADTKLPPAFDRDILVTLTQPGVICGAFQFGLDILHENNSGDESDSVEEKQNSTTQKGVFEKIFEFQMKILEKGTNYRAKTFELPYGDQALFMNRKVFHKLGGFPEYDLLEDYIMVKSLQTMGHIKIVEGAFAVTSSRRWQKHGYLRITGLNFFIIQAYKLGIHPNTLASWYRYFSR